MLLLLLFACWLVGLLLVLVLVLVLVPLCWWLVGGGGGVGGAGIVVVVAACVQCFIDIICSSLLFGISVGCRTHYDLAVATGETKLTICAVLDMMLSLQPGRVSALESDWALNTMLSL